MEGSAMPTTVESRKAMPVPRTVAARTQRPRAELNVSVEVGVDGWPRPRSRRAGAGRRHCGQWCMSKSITLPARTTVPAGVAWLRTLPRGAWEAVVVVVVDALGRGRGAAGRRGRRTGRGGRRGRGGADREAGPVEPGQVEQFGGPVERTAGDEGNRAPVGVAARPRDADRGALGELGAGGQRDRPNLHVGRSTRNGQRRDHALADQRAHVAGRVEGDGREAGAAETWNGRARASGQ